MLTFEKLLVKELQKQQSRAEFCDIVLQSQGVSVPVHSCVLSAFSPRLCGALSSMPSPQNGQRRLIEVPAVEACTLLGLVSLLYSGQFTQNKEDVLSAAGQLGIDIPQREAQRPNDQNTQTEFMKEVSERDCQTETLTSEAQNQKESVETVNASSWRSDQGLCVYTDSSEISLNVQGNPEVLPAFQALDMAHENAVYPAVSGAACLPQVYICPPAASFQTSVPQPQISSVEALVSQGGPVSEGAECVLETFARFENNIPGFINYFLDANTSQDGVQVQRGEVKIEGRGRRARKAGANGGFNVKGERVNVCRRQQNANRFGRVARWIGTGRGGGRVGGMIETRQKLKTRGKRKAGRGMQKEEAEKGRSSARGRQRGTGRAAHNMGQEPAPASRRRGRPRKNPLASAAIEVCAPSLQEKTVSVPAPSMMHTAPLPAANQSALNQPIDWLIDDVIAQLPFMPNAQNGMSSTPSLDSSVDQQRSQSTVKLADIGIVQPQTEGELTDILDSFLRTFENHVGSCDSDIQDVPNISNGSSVCEQSMQNYASNTQPASVNTSTPASNAMRRPRAARRPQKPFGYWQVTGVKTEKAQSEEMLKTGRMTRSQNRKRKLEENEQREQIPTKRRKKTKRERKCRLKGGASLVRDVTDNTRKPNGETKHSTVNSNRDVTNALRKVINNVKRPHTLQRSSDQSKSEKNCSFVKKKQVCPAKKDVIKPCLAGNTSQAKQSVAMNKTNTTRPAVTAFEIMKRILENQQKREEERRDYGIWTVKRQKRKKRREDGRVEVKGHNRSRKKKNNTDGGRKKKADDQSLPSSKDCPMSKGEQLMENCNGESRFQTIDSLNDSPFQRHSTKGVIVKHTADVPFISHSPTKTNTTLRNTRGSSDSSEEDVDVVEVTSSLSESVAALPVTDIILSSEEEECDEDEEIDVISLGSC